jgi:ADP-ribose pyrophosphatase
MLYEEKTVARRNVFEGSVIRVDSLEVLLQNGKKVKRDLVLHPGASVIIPINENNELYMVRQYRKPIEKISLEIPAGKLDAGEEPLECAIRELKEETGVEAEKVKHLFSIHSTPGFCNEILHMFVATGIVEGKACTDEDEFLSVEKIHIDKLMDMVLSGEITDAKTVIGIMAAQRIVHGEIDI